jgi:hypothetical protein
MSYRIAGTYSAACSCMQICPCPIDGKPIDPEGKGECRGYAVFKIRDGSLDQTDLGGVSFALYNYFPSNITAGNWKVGIVVDDGASDDQAQAVERIISGQEGGPFGDFVPLIGEYVGMDRAPVTVSTGETPAVSVEGRSEFTFEPHRGVDGSPTTVKGAPYAFAPEYQIGTATGHGDAFGGFEARYGEYADFEYSSEGAPEVHARA